MARLALSLARYPARVSHSLPGSHLGTPAVRSEAAELLRHAGRRSQGPTAAFLQAGQARIQEKDRRGQDRTVAAPQALPLPADSTGAPGRQRLPLSAPAVLHDRLLSEGPPRLDPPDGGRHQGGAAGRDLLRGCLLDAHCRGPRSVPPGLCPPVYLPVATRHHHAGPDDWARNGGCPHAGLVAGPKTPVRARARREDHAQCFVFWMQKGRTGLHLQGGTGGLPQRRHTEGPAPCLFAKGSHPKRIRPAPAAEERGLDLHPAERTGGLRVRLRGRQDGARRDRNPQGNSGGRKQRVRVARLRRKLLVDPLERGPIRPRALVVSARTQASTQANERTNERSGGRGRHFLVSKNRSTPHQTKPGKEARHAIIELNRTLLFIMAKSLTPFVFLVSSQASKTEMMSFKHRYRCC
mmetsp:Transcript_10566/g.21233  ORF Transcript_10566/g.21233 Transcript_10566/m.21233 type:complete len:409 (-) Transcript_10566:303-1529(-)